jgi:hypothetical protein
LHWRELTGAPLASWQGRRKDLPVRLDVGADLNANYDRFHLNFYHYDFPNRRVSSCESPDVTCHEQGHALLDALRPDFWGAPFFEIAAFHESWGDCVAMGVAFNDLAQCKAALAVGLDRDNLISNLAEDLAVAIAQDLGQPDFVDSPPPHPALRKALNDWRYVDPLTLPPGGPARQLCCEAHSFSRVFTGAFYDLIRNLVASAAKPTPQRLRSAAHLAGELLLAAAQTVPVVPDFFAAVAQRVLQADAQLHDGLHATEIRAAFERHGIPLYAPAVSLNVPLLPDRAVVSRAEAGEPLLARMGFDPAAAVGVEYTQIDSEMHGEMAHVAAFRHQDVSDVHPALAGVHALVPATARLQVDSRSVLGIFGEPLRLEAPVRGAARGFIKALLESGNIEADAAIASPLPPPPPRRPGPATHAIQPVAGRRTVVRVRFAC